MSKRPLSWNRFAREKVKRTQTVLEIGKFNGLCFRGACQGNVEVNWRHIHSMKFYCSKCARMINEAQREEYPNGLIVQIR